MRTLYSLLIVLTALTSTGREQAFELKDGDRVAFLGDTFIERMQAVSYTHLTLPTILRV